MTRAHFLHLDAWTCGQSQTLALAVALRDAGWDARVICRRESPLYDAARARRIPAHFLPPSGVFSPSVLWSFFQALAALPKISPCLVQACDPAASHLASFAARWKKNLRLAHIWRGPLSSPAGERIARYLKPTVPIVADNEAGAAWLRGAGLNIEQVRLIPCGLDSAGSEPHTPRNDGRFVLAVTGGLTDDKGHSALFDALAVLALRPNLPPWELRVLGQGPLFHALLGEAESKSIAGHLAFLGGQNSRSQLAACDALVLPASGGEHCLPLILQGWACGVPVVAVERPEYADTLRPGENCLTVPPDDRQALADAIVRLAGDESLREQLRRGGQETLKRFSLAAMVRAYADLYESIYQNGGLRPPPPLQGDKSP